MDKASSTKRRDRSRKMQVRTQEQKRYFLLQPLMTQRGKVKSKDFSAFLFLTREPEETTQE
jgi:hypothetical protein